LLLVSHLHSSNKLGKKTAGILKSSRRLFVVNKFNNMKRFKIGLAVLAALVTMSFTITSRSGLLAGTYSVEGITCFNVLTISGTNHDADNGDQLPDQVTAGLKEVEVGSADVDLIPTGNTLFASLVTSATGSVRVRSCSNEDITSVCCFQLSSGSIINFATGIAMTFF
jgi:hypothetical protein